MFGRTHSIGFLGLEGYVITAEDPEDDDPEVEES
jgi:hypothetical protein